MKRQQRLAFTLIELLTVIAITAVLLTIIVVPVIQSFKLTRQAQAFAEAQNQARVLSERVSREIGNSVGVRDLGTLAKWVDHTGATRVSPASSVVAIVPTVNPDGTVLSGAPSTEVLLPYSKLDIIRPASVVTLNSITPDGYYRDPNTGLIDPTLAGPKGQVMLPVAQGMAMTRYWIGLRQPVLAGTVLTSQRYADPYSGLLMKPAGGRDNLYVLYRAQVQPYIFRTSSVPGASQGGARVLRPNLAYFQADATDSTIVDWDAPDFFALIPNQDVSNDVTGALTASGLAKAQRMLNWQKAATIQTEVSRYDMILPVYDKASRKVQNVGGVPSIVTLAQFRPARVSAETVAGETATRLGEETSSGAAVAPDSFLTQYSLWSNPVIRTYPVGFASPTNSSPTLAQSAYEVGRRLPTGDLVVMSYEPGVDVGDDLTGGTPLFDIDTYQNPSSSSTLAAFSQAVNAGALSDPIRAQIFTPYTVNMQTGKIIASFSISEVGSLANPTPPIDTSNIPYVPTCGADNTPYTPFADPTILLGGTFSSNIYASVNEKYNRLWADYPQLRGVLHRFIDLRVTKQPDGNSFSPLYPNPVSGQPTGLGATYDAQGYNRYSRASIVPGTESVIGPDETAGANYGQPVRYTRVNQNPGPNQYCINYTDLPEPTDANQNLAYTSVFGNVGEPLATYDPNDLVTAVLQPRYKAGYLQLCSDPNVPIPNGYIEVSYRFQISGHRSGSLAQLPQAIGTSNTDVFSVDYDSRQLINVLFTIRNYPQSDAPNPQTVTLKSTASVRNYLR